MRLNKLIKLGVIGFLLSFSCFKVYSSSEIIQISPLLGEIGNEIDPNNPVQSQLTKFRTIYKYQNKPYYQVNSTTTLLANKYLLLKYFQLLSDSNSNFLEQINQIDETYQNISNRLDNKSLNNLVKDKLFTAELTPLVTKLIDRGMSPSDAMSMALKFTLERESIKNQLIILLPIINEVNYDFFAEVIVNSVDLAIEAYPLVLGSGTSQSITLALQNSFSHFVGIPLAIWETGLKVGKAGNALFGLSKLLKAQNVEKVDTLAAIFLYDFVNHFNADINEIKSYVESYSVAQIENGAFRKIVVSEDPSKYKQVKVSTFYDIFYYYILINNEQAILSDFSFFKDSNKVILIKSARVALDYIEKFGNGGNYSLLAKYQYELNLDSKKLKKKLHVDEDSFRFEPLYFMPRIEDFYGEYDAIGFFYDSRSFSPAGFKVLSDFPVKINVSNAKRSVAENFQYGPIIDIVDEYGPNSDELVFNAQTIYVKASPEITIEAEYSNNYRDVMYLSTQKRKIAPFYIGYGAFDNYAIEDKSPIYLDPFINFYNAGMLDFSSNSYGFLPDLNAKAEFVVHAFFKYANQNLSIIEQVRLLKDFSLSGHKGLEISSRPVSRADLAELLINYYQLEKIKPNRLFIMNPSEWTSEGKTLFELGLMNGDSNGKMNANGNISVIEVMLMAERLKELLK